MNVLLLRSPHGADPYLRALADEGHTATCVDVVSFDFVGVSAMREALSQPERFGGLVITSPRTTAAWRRDSEAPGLLASWDTHRTFAVGPRTADDARELGLRPEGQTEGGAQALAAYIIANRPEKPLLFCCGRPRRPELPDALSRAGVPCEEVVVYGSKLASEPPNGVVPDVVVFFSPRAAEVIGKWPWPWPEIQKAWVGDSASRIAAAGEVTAGYHDVDGLVRALKTG